MWEAKFVCLYIIQDKIHDTFKGHTTFCVYYYIFVINDHLLEEFEDTKWAIRNHKSKRTDNTMTKRIKAKRTNSDRQNIHIQLKIK